MSTTPNETAALGNENAVTSSGVDAVSAPEATPRSGAPNTARPSASAMVRAPGVTPLRVYTVPAVPPLANHRLRAVVTRGRARLATTGSVDAWQAVVRDALLQQDADCHAEGRLAVCLVFRFGSDRRDVDSGIKDALDAMAARKCRRSGVTLTTGALFANDRQVSVLIVVRDHRKGPVSTEVAVAPLDALDDVIAYADAQAEAVRQ